MTKDMKTTCLAAFLLVLSFCVSCAPESVPFQRGPVIRSHGNYRVILNGCNFLNDLETIAFLDKKAISIPSSLYPDFNSG